jgi:hypothetical protein
VTKSDDRDAEKEKLSLTRPAGAASAPELDEDGRLYRADLRGEIVRLAHCLNARSEAEALLEALGEPTAERLKQILADYQARFDRHFGPAQDHPFRANTCGVAP